MLSFKWTNICFKGEEMNYTKTIRTYCLQNKGKIFDAGKMAEDYFSMVPYKTMMKVLNRLEEEEILQKVSKGVYFICDENTDIDDAIIGHYVGEKDGIIVGEKMWYQQGLINKEPDTIEIYTNKISQQHKNVGKYKLTYANLVYGTDICNIIRFLDALEKIDNKLNVDLEKYALLGEKCEYSYTDFRMKKILEEIDFQYATLITLSEMLRNNGYDGCNCLAIAMEVKKSE